MPKVLGCFSRGVPIATVIGLIARAAGLDPAAALEMAAADFAALVRKARVRVFS
ncbi:hypothetical protein [Pendulispora albinea]|uniref:Uncharacterized protein n=1 Tax=Pendulispora albinea TaxID=2741071 RepID=A0ABZ2LYH5_9BACT